jgi:CspA family cold shock protein
MTGTVVLWKEATGWGFIRPDLPGLDLFVHFTFINDDGRGKPRKSLWPGQRVRYDEQEGDRGPEAREVVVLWAGSRERSR